MATSDSNARTVDRVFLTPRGRPRLVDGAVLFVDLLGVREMNQSRRVAAHLVALERAVRRTYRAFLAPRSQWAAAFFSDTLVLAAPVMEDPESAVGDLVTQAARLQLELISAGFFMRGGLSLGKIHLRDGIVYGPALVEAHDLESGVAVHPRIVLSDEVERLQRRSLRSYDEQEVALQSAMLLRDDDGRAFVNYLGRILVAQPDPPLPSLERHRDAIISRLIAYSNEKHFWEKYRWVADYHNAVVRQELPNAADLLVPAASMTWRFRAFA